WVKIIRQLASTSEPHTTVLEYGSMTGLKLLLTDQGNRSTPSMVAFTSREQLVGDAALFQISCNYRNRVYDVKRIIGRQFTDPSVEADRKHPNLSLSLTIDGKPMIEVDYRGEKKLFLAEEISLMVLAKMKKIAEEYLMCDVHVNLVAWTAVLSSPDIAAFVWVVATSYSLA
ncbi:hypothetical protein KI387_042774, partial [Taxus chinensis]